LALALLASCQSYEPRPLDSAAHREAWRARTLEKESLREFLDRLDRSAVDAEDFDPADGLSLPEGQLVALVFNPSLRIARLRVGRAAAGAEHAGRPADPELDLALLRSTESVPDPWVITPGLSFSIPLSGRLEAERGLAEAERRAAEGAVLAAEWSVWRDVRVAWIEWSAARLRALETERLVAELEGLVRTVSELAERGEIPRAEASLLRVEEVQRRNQLRRSRGEVDAWEQRLRGLMGLAPTAPVALVPALPPAGTGDETTAAGQEAIELRNVELARLRREYELSEEALRLEVRKQYPDLTLGPLFESDEGQSRIGFLGGIPLPFLNANRRAIAEARAEREIARAALEGAYEELVGRWAAETARAESLASQREELVELLVPLVDRQVEEAFELLRLGEHATTLVLLESLTRAFQAKLELLDTRAAEALAHTEIAFLIGPETDSEASPDASGAAEEQR
jgi:outer membrane protein TolC